MENLRPGESSPPPAMDAEVLIVGAGPTGLVLALWLTKLGVRFRIIEKEAALPRTSRAVVIHARTLEFYRQIGIDRPIVENGLRVGGINFWGQGVKAVR